MLRVGASDVFERNYTQRFRKFAGSFGEFVTYERDRGARDIGIHLTHKLKSGGDRLSGALCWFQLKGLTRTTVSKEGFRNSDSVGVPLKVPHLQYWYLQPMPTYLAVFIESVETFLVLNLQKYVSDNWGPSIFSLTQKEVTVHVPRSSVLDEQALGIILAKSDIEEWMRALGTDREGTSLARRDYNLIWQLGTASKRTVETRVEIVDWQSKTRGEIHFQERPEGDVGHWKNLRIHWQFLLSAEDVESMYPYIEFYALDVDDWESDDEDWVPKLELRNGDIISGADASGEYFVYLAGAKLNELGRRLFESVKTLAKIGLIEIGEGDDGFISIAPWEGRSV